MVYVRDMKVRFAPSPTGFLHIGNVRTALVNWLYAKKNNGDFLLRIDDTDAERSRDEYEIAIKQDLQWLGLSWDETAKQSERADLYEAAKKQLIAEGRLYPCYETNEELNVNRKMQLSRGVPPIYDRTGLKLTDEQKTQYEKDGRTPHWRFLLTPRDRGHEEIIWTDAVRGEVSFDTKNLSDPILIREDGKPTYTLSSVVDDGNLAVDHIMRGEDHVTNTAVQIQLFKALGYSIPTFAHFALIKSKDGEMSKRTGGFEIKNLRAGGIEAISICSYLAKIGTSDAIHAYENLEQLVNEFDVAKFGRASASYDDEELNRINKKVVGTLEFNTVKERISSEINADFWNNVRHNIDKVGDIQEWWDICHDSFQPIITDAEYLKIAGDLLPKGAWNDATFKEWTTAIKEQTGRKGKDLFMPLRLALTGKEKGPELKTLLVILGKEKVLKRL